MSEEFVVQLPDAPFFLGCSNTACMRCPCSQDACTAKNLKAQETGLAGNVACAPIHFDGKDNANMTGQFLNALRKASLRSEDLVQQKHLSQAMIPASCIDVKYKHHH